MLAAPEAQLEAPTARRNNFGDLCASRASFEALASHLG